MRPDQTAAEGDSMAEELDPNLVSLLKAALGLVDALRDIGAERRVAVRLDRAAGLRLRQLAGARAGNSVALAGITFEWPKALNLETLAANDNDSIDCLGGAPLRR